MNIQNKKIGIIGTGNMGESLIKGLISFMKFKPDNLYASDIDKIKLDDIKNKYQIKINTTSDLLENVDIIIIAVKPQQIKDILREIKIKDKSYELIISIAAGIETAQIEEIVQKNLPIIRVMPNICATVNASVSALSKGQYVTNQSFEIAKILFESVGKVVEVKEQLMDVVTGLSGSGPAYIFLAIEALSDAGVFLGLPREISTILAAQTTLGAAKMVLETGLHPGVLKDKVTSPGGTTIRGIAALEKYKFRAALIDAVKAATERSRELRTT